MFRFLQIRRNCTCTAVIIACPRSWAMCLWFQLYSSNYTIPWARRSIQGSWANSSLLIPPVVPITVFFNIFFTTGVP
uniref:Uncharacterized protein n=1 Tax=Ixodes ricinus TaxID=34613 RepID=A0A6B0U5Y7_IXORI